MLLALSLLSLLACGGPTPGATTHDPVDSPATCPAGGHTPEEGPEGVYDDCAVLFEGCCFAAESDACQAAGCGPSCDVQEDYPGSVQRCDVEASCPTGGVAPVAGPDGVPEDCAILFEGCCFADTSDACRAAGCGDTCTYLQSYPGQLGRCE
ncbi:MAG: hypothetical protein AB8I08_23885 [Sandaracinaceae bacterium]